MLTAAEWGLLVIWLARLAGSLPVLKWPLAGGLLAVAVDLFDLVLMNTLTLPQPFDYQGFDKAADMMYLLTFLAVAARWSPFPRHVAFALFAVRMAGVALFEFTGERGALFLFPNLFESWFLLVAARDRFAPDYALTSTRTRRWLGALLVVKLAQEYLLHIDRRLDPYTLPEAIEWLRQWWH